MSKQSDEDRATQMARSFTPIDFGGTIKARAESILAFVTAVRAEASAAEREACAKVAERSIVISRDIAEYVAAAIRARKP